MSLDLPGTDAPRTSPSLASWQLNRALELFETNIDRPIRLEVVADAVRLSVSRFSGAFRGSVGESPARYLRRRRVKKAQDMMLLTGESLATIAVECGFADQSHFTRIFSRMVGVSPAAWRRALFQRARTDESASPRGCTGSRE
jgi:AraC family transcriptional regulator